MMKKTARENGVDPNELKFISDRGSAIIKCLSVCTHFNFTFHITSNLIKYVKRETGVALSSEDGKVINTLLSEIAETADITEAVRKIWTIIGIFRKGLSSENSKKYKSMEEVSQCVGAEVVRYIMEKSNKEQWMTLVMSPDHADMDILLHHLLSPIITPLEQQVGYHLEMLLSTSSTKSITKSRSCWNHSPRLIMGSMLQQCRRLSLCISGSNKGRTTHLSTLKRIMSTSFTRMEQ